MDRLRAHLVRPVVVLALWLGACNDDPGATLSPGDASVTSPDLSMMVPPPDMVDGGGGGGDLVLDMVRPSWPGDGAAPGKGSVFCGHDKQGKVVECSNDKPFCCYFDPRSSDGTCVGMLDGCPHWVGCISNAECPADHPFCCGDNKPNIDCRASCKVSYCGSDDECPPEHPKCLPSMEAFNTCQ